MKGKKADNPKVLDRLLRAGAQGDAGELNSFSEWKELFDAETAGWDEPADRALIGGHLSDRIAYAFAAGYECALRRLIPALPLRTIVSFCVTEEQGGHPATIRTSLTRDGGSPEGGWRLNGRKKFATMAPDAGLLVVAASLGSTPEGKNMIRMALIDRASPGITITPMTGIPFIPEIVHGAIDFHDVPVEDSRLLPGEGYIDYIKPFRTIEDLHVTAAVLGYLLRIAARYGWPRDLHERLACLILTVRSLALDDPDAPATHIAMGGAYALIGSMLGDMETCWDRTDGVTKAGWERDRALLGVAEKARKKRLESAWGKIG